MTPGAPASFVWPISQFGVRLGVLACHHGLDVAVRLAGGNVHVVLELQARQRSVFSGTGPVCSHLCRSQLTVRDMQHLRLVHTSFMSAHNSSPCL